MSSTAHNKSVITKPRFSVTAGPMGHRLEHKQTVVEVGNCSHPSDRCYDDYLREFCYLVDYTQFTLRYDLNTVIFEVFCEQIGIRRTGDQFCNHR